MKTIAIINQKGGVSKTSTASALAAGLALAPIGGAYDFCIIDTAPALSVLLVAVLAASQGVVIPATATVLSLDGLDQLQETIAAVRPHNKSLEICGILITQYNGRNRVSRILKETIEKKADDMGTRVFSTTIRAGVALQEAQLMKQDLFSYAPRVAITGDYEAFVDEFLTKGEK